MRQSEFKKRYDPESGRFTRQHIYGEGVMAVLKNIGSKVFSQTLKKAADKAITTTASKTGEHLGKKAGDEIIKMLSKRKKPKKVTFDEPIKQGKKAGDEIIKMLSNTPKPMTQQDRYQQLGQILSDDQKIKKII